MDNQHMVYMLACKDGSLYTGYTNHLQRRLQLHEEGKGAKYTRGRGPFRVVYVAYFPSKEEAMKEEYRIKQLPSKNKRDLIASHKEGFEWDEHPKKLSN